jgi:F0F1-type ATP synthase assembly protein I
MMPLAAVIGYYLGDLFDKHFHTGSIGQIIGLMLGAAGGFIELLRTISRDQ